MSNNTLTVHKISHGLCGELTVPGDKSISHRVAIMGALSGGTMQVKNYLCSADCLNTLAAMQQLGAKVIPEPTPQDFTLIGTGMKAMAPARDIDCGNSGTGMRLMAGVLAALPFNSRLYGDASLSKRPMNRIISPLQKMGAHIEAQGTKEGCAPLQIYGKKLSPITYTLPMASAQVKSAVLLAGMLTPGTTTVHQPAITRDHTERLLTHFGIPATVSEDGLTISVTGPVSITAKDITVPADISSAAFWIVAAAITPGSKLSLTNVGLNPTRNAILNVLQRMGADILITPICTDGEPYGNITVSYSPQLKGTVILPEEIPNLIDEIPILAVAAAYAQGVTSIRNAAELRVKESDRIATTVQNLRAMGAKAEEFDDGMVIHGGTPLRGTVLDSFDDHRIAMSFLIAGLRAEGKTTLLNCENINTSYPGFAEHLHRFLNA